MKRFNRCLSVLCLALALCLAASLALPVAPAALAELQPKGEPVLTADVSEITMFKGESTVVTITYKRIGSLSAKYDNAAVAKCKLSGKWDGEKTTMTIDALETGKCNITISNSVTSDTLKIRVVVTGRKNLRYEIRTLAGRTVTAANKELPNALKTAASGYDNGRFKVALDPFRRIKTITLYGGKGAYRLFSCYPGMPFTTAVNKLKRQGWKQAKRTSKGYFFISDSDPFHAIQIVKRSSKVYSIVYYLP